MFFKKKKEKTPKTSNRKVVPNMKPIEELRTNKDVAVEFQTIPSTMSSMMTMTISQPFHSQKPSKPERKETI